MRNRGLEPVEVPLEADYTMLLEQRGIGLAHARLRENKPLTGHDITVYLAHSRVTEQRASEQMRLLRRAFRNDTHVGAAVRQISADEDNHLAYCHEELLRLAKDGRRAEIDAILRSTAHAEIKVCRDVTLAVMARMGRILGWSKAKSAVLAVGVHGIYVYERLGGWRRMTSLRMPKVRNALGSPSPVHAAGAAGAARRVPTRTA